MNDDQMQLTRIEQLLQDNLEATREVNELVRDLRRWGRLGFWFRIVIWAAVIILPLLLLRPILQTLIPAAGTGGAGSGFFGFPSQSDIEEALDSYQGGTQ
ncbi:MAG: hypothetical protein QOE22_116 [Candidatus Parcubacteria bacterium]|jgi:hypothetical protein|nr:hypothetical protein [Candidatus Parcubacteria bacterium]